MAELATVANPENPHAGQGAVMLDVGGDVGAIVVVMPARLTGVEIEIRPAGQSHLEVFGTDGHDGTVPGASSAGHDHPHGHDHEHDHAHADHAHGDAQTGVEAHVHPWPHVAVVARPAGGRMVPSAVFAEVTEGRYDLYVRPHGPVRLSVDVVGAEVSEVVWPD